MSSAGRVGRLAATAAAATLLLSASACGGRPDADESPSPSTAASPAQVSAAFCRDANDYLWFSFAFAGQEPEAVPHTPAGLRHAYTRAAALADDLVDQVPPSRRSAGQHLRDSLQHATAEFAKYGFDTSTYPADLQADLVKELEPYQASIDTYTAWLYSTCSERFEATASPGSASITDSGETRFSPGPDFPTPPPDARQVR